MISSLSSWLSMFSIMSCFDPSCWVLFSEYKRFTIDQVQSKEDVQLGANIHKLSIRRSQLNFECLETQEHRTLLCGRLEDSLWMKFCIVVDQNFSFSGYYSDHKEATRFLEYFSRGAQ